MADVNSQTTSPYTVTVPHDDGSSRPSCDIRRRGELIAVVYVTDDDDGLAYRRAQVMAHALYEGEADD